MNSFVRYFPIPSKPHIKVTFSCGCVKRFRSDKHLDIYACEEHTPDLNFGFESKNGLIVQKRIDRKYIIQKRTYWRCDICDFTGSDYEDESSIKCPNCEEGDL